MDKKSADILRRAKALIDRPEKWFGPPEWRGHGGNCAGTAIMEASGIDRWDHPLIKFFGKVACGNEIFTAKWNNTPGRTHADVMAAFDRAIALAEGRISDEAYTARFISDVVALPLYSVKEVSEVK